MKLLNPIRDWWRGYSDQDVISACAKILREKNFPIDIESCYSDSEMSVIVKEWLLTTDDAQRLLKQYEEK